MTPATWHTREVPLLEAVRAAERTRERPGAKLEIDYRRLGMKFDDFAQAVYDLWPEYLDAELIPRRGRIGRVQVYGLTARGRRAIGQWPPGSDCLAAALESVADDEVQPDRRARLMGLATEVRAAGPTGAGALLERLAS